MLINVSPLIGWRGRPLTKSLGGGVRFTMAYVKIYAPRNAKCGVVHTLPLNEKVHEHLWRLYESHILELTSLYVFKLFNSLIWEGVTMQYLF